MIIVSGLFSGFFLLAGLGAIGLLLSKSRSRPKGADVRKIEEKGTIGYFLNLIIYITTRSSVFATNM
jgi:hypothetical protein